jgi:GNAT superfamily N-acetyltransferase
MSGELDIAAWTDADRDDVIGLILSIQQREFELPITLDDQPDLADPPGFYGVAGGRFWVGRRNGELVGTIAALVVDESTAVVRKMFVHKDARGGDVAGRLMETLVEWTRATGYRTLLLGTTSVMRGAHRFYAKHGFAEITADSLPAVFPRMAVDSVFFRRDLAGVAVRGPIAGK